MTPAQLEEIANTLEVCPAWVAWQCCERMAKRYPQYTAQQFFDALCRAYREARP